MERWYDIEENGVVTGSKLRADESDNATMSSSDKSEYVRPYQINPKQVGYEGFTWHMAHYLSPLPINQFLVTAPDGQTIEDSPLYQNPYWPTTADMPAEK